ncbi:MFS family permease [Allocatelliglobosispora scoriae]|uniref:MFS family permease n=1 Tax=Allocatelliglobosispora scoriae TaxID=643052 RepID=A0A841BTU1_9ACTN|nr:MFS transporter [Allocatelliglobosispora scoriae]MBB5870162.1 MFS family permease [Allocatelliglobosispora scoriae]
MSLAPYRQVLAVPGVRALLLIGMLARIPSTAIGMTLTLHVATGLHRSWAEAGLVTAAYTIGVAIGSPLMGRLIDRRGMRPAMLLTTLVQLVVWSTAPHLSYQLLVPAALVGGLLCIPIFGTIRIALAAMVPGEQRRPAYALDSMIVELSFMVGPALAVLLATTLSTGTGIYLLAVGLVVSGATLFVMNPATRPEGQEIPEVAPPRRSWFGPRLVAVLIASAAATFILSATDLAIVAMMREAGAITWTGVAIALWCAYSLIGGLVFGAIRKPISVLTLVAVMGLLTIPAGMAPTWQWLLLLLIPSGVLCAPAMVAANDTLSRVVPPASRGEATGLLGSAMTAGTTIGAPFAGFVVDHTGPGWAFAVAGLVGAVAVLAALPAYRRAPALAPAPA